MATPCPTSYDHIWYYWLDLSRTRQSGLSSPAAISYSELKAWAELRPDHHINSKIVDLIIRIDGVFRRLWNERSKPEKEESNG